MGDDDDVIEILSDSETDEEGDGRPDAKLPAMVASVASPSRPRPAVNVALQQQKQQQQPQPRRSQISVAKKRSNNSNNGGAQQQQPQRRRSLQTGLVLEEDIDHATIHSRSSSYNNNKNATLSSSSSSSDTSNDEMITLESYIQQQQKRQANGELPILYHDIEFESCPASIEGGRRENKQEKCRCSPSQPVAMSYVQKGQNKGKPYYHCSKRGKFGEQECKYFRWAFKAQSMHWYRFGNHTNHTIVQNTGFSANDLIQGKVGDCWFLSALAVIAEREDLIARLFGKNGSALNNNNFGIVQVNLFVDGFWTKVVMDNFLPCIIDGKAENDFQQALNASLGISSTAAFQGTGYTLNSSSSSAKKNNNESNEEEEQDEDRNSSKYDPFALSDKNRQVLAETKQKINSSSSLIPAKLDRVVTTDDLAYSKAKNQQLWVPFLEKAYSKAHGSYQAISGGQIAEAFLDLTGAPTSVYDLHNDSNFDPRSFWYRLMSYRKQRLPMGCATSSSAGGIIGMHAYSILDVREVKNVGLGFFTDKLADRTLGNVSGFTEFDGTVRLLRIRNPHGQGEWKGEFSDKSEIWDKLLQHKGSPDLERTMQNDGVFWIDYDAFLMAFCRVDVVLAFVGNHARSFRSNFPAKQSTHRCARAFELCLLDPQPGVPSRDTVEVYVMGIQKTKRGAYHGRADRKVSYKISDMGVLVGSCGENYQKCDLDLEADGTLEFDSVEGQMFGFRRDCHHKMILDRKKKNRLVVMPISFGHPAATDAERSFAVRFVADAPLHIRELDEVPRMDKAVRTYFFGPRPSFSGCQRERKVILDDEDGRRQYGEPRYRVVQINCLAKRGGVVFIHLCMNQRLLDNTDNGNDFEIDLAIEATCRGMMMRTAIGFLKHETMAKGKKYEAAWRKYSTDFHSESGTRLLAVLVQSGQDSEMGSIVCKKIKSTSSNPKKGGEKKQTTLEAFGESSTNKASISIWDSEYEKYGIFHASKSVASVEMHNAMFGNARDIVGSSMMGADVFDLELERALAISRGDIEMRDALELSKTAKESLPPGLARDGAPGMSLDEQIQLALERSRVEVAASNSAEVAAQAGNAGIGAADDFDDDLNEAIKRSLEETKRSNTKEVVEIDSPEARAPSAPPTKKQKRETKGHVGGDDLIELDSATTKESSRYPLPRQAKPESGIIEIADDDSDEESATDPTEEVELTAADKRRLAAEAAERRFRALEK